MYILSIEYIFILEYLRQNEYNKRENKFDRKGAVE